MWTKRKPEFRQEKAETIHWANLKQNFVDEMPYDILLDEKFEEALEKLKKKSCNLNGSRTFRCLLKKVRA